MNSIAYLAVAVTAILAVFLVAAIAEWAILKLFPARWPNVAEMRGVIARDGYTEGEDDRDYWEEYHLDQQ